MQRKLVVPFGTGPRSGHQCLHDGAALGLIAGKRAREVGFPLQGVRQCNRVLQRKPGTGADGEVSRVQRVAYQNHIADMPMLAP